MIQRQEHSKQRQLGNTTGTAWTSTGRIAAEKLRYLLTANLVQSEPSTRQGEPMAGNHENRPGQELYYNTKKQDRTRPHRNIKTPMQTGV